MITSMGCEGDLTNNGGDDPAQDMSTTPGVISDMPGVTPGVDMPGVDMPQLPASDCGVTALYQKLEPTCATCHRSGSTPYFASPEAFYNLIVADPYWVMPGDSQGSELLALLRGEAKGAYAQMPLGEDSFADLEARGQTQVTLAEMSEFITDLDGCQRSAPEGSASPPVERKRARQIVNTLYQHLGLTKDDVLPFSRSRNYNDSLYPVYNPDDIKPVTNDPHIRPATQGPGIRWFALGGESRLYITRASSTFSPTFGQALIQVSQAWCGFSVEKEDNTALFAHVDRGALSSASDAQVRQNIGYMMLRFWGHIATDEDIDAMKTGVYDTYIPAQDATEEDARTAWVAVCATLIRDPMWLSY